jgi:transposase-like protein
MRFHANHRLGLPQRRALVAAIEGGMTLKAAAAAFSVAPATAHRWWHRWRAADEAARRSLVCLHDRSSCPRRQPRRLSVEQEAPILRARLETGLGPGRLAGIVPWSRSTIWKVLRRNGCSRRRRHPQAATKRYEWSRPGALLHLDTARLPAFQRPGHRVRGRSTETRRDKRGWGYVFVTLPSTITAATPTSSSIATSAARPARASCGARSRTLPSSASPHPRR